MNKPLGEIYDWKSNASISNDLHYAGFWIRLLALAIDFVIGFILFFILTFFVDTDTWGDRGIGFLMFLLILALRTYFQFINGQSIGQRFTKIKIVSEHRKSIGRILVRNLLILLFLLIPLANAVSAFVLAFSKEKQGLHDRGVDTWVIKERELNGAV